MFRNFRSRPLLYAFSVGVTLLALVITLQVPRLAEASPLALFFLAVAVAARVGGIGPALFSALLSVLVLEYYVIPPVGVFEWPRDGVIFGAFVAVSAVISTLLGSQRRAELEQAESSRRLALMIKASNDAIMTCDLKGYITSWNKAAERIYGYAAEEAIGKHAAIITPPAYLPELDKQVATICRGELVPNHESERITKDGRRITVNVSASPVLDSRGKASGLLRIARDVTEEKNSREALEKARLENERSLAMLQAFINSAPIGFSLHDSKTRYLMANDKLVADNNVPRERCIGHTLIEALPELGPKVAPLMEKVYETGEPVDFEMEGDTVDPHRERYWSARYFPIRTAAGENVGVGTAVADITEQRRVERRMVMQARMLNQVIQPVILRDSHDRITYWNTGAEQLYGYSREEAIGRVINELLHTRYPVSLEHATEELRRNGHWQGELHHFTKSGSELTVDSRWLRFVNGEGESILETNYDVTALKKTEAERETILQRLDIAQRFANMGAWEWNIRTGELWWSQGVIELNELDASNPSVEQWLSKVHPDDRVLIEEAIANALENDAPYDVTYRVNIPDGGLRWVGSRGHVIRDENGKPLKMIGIGMDLTRQQLEQEALRRTEKLAAAGRLAATVAHEINNPLEAVTNLLYLIRREPGLSGSAQQYLTMAEEELTRVTHIARQTLGFYRESTTPIAVNLSQMLEKLIAVYARRLQRKGVMPDLKFQANAVTNGFPGELNQLFSNLISNSLDALHHGGVLYLRTRVASSGTVVTVADNGSGISGDHLDRIFEPFFTTKKDVGTGLGLWVTRNIVEKHGAKIHVRSRATGAKTYTVFRVSFRAAQQQSAGA